VKSDGLLLLAVAGFAALLLFGTVGVEVHRLLAELAGVLQTAVAS
jgi:hypothetical protein